MKKEWWQEIFNQDYIKTYIDITSDDITNRQISFLVNLLKPIAKKNILDLGCGYGRHSIKLAKRGCSVIGLDYSKFFLSIARKKAKQEKLKAKFIFGDMRHLTFRNEFDAIICLFTSFGYFNKYSDHELVVEGISKALKPDGLLILDLNNPAKCLIEIIRNNQLDSKTGVLSDSRTDKLSNGFKINIKQEFDLAKMRWKLIREWKEGESKRKYSSDIYLFNLPEIKYLLESHGLKVEKIYGDFDGSVYHWNSKRLIILARKLIIF